MSRSLVATNTGSRFSGYIAAGLMLGIFCGLFFGEYTSWIKWIGDAFVGLLQMAILPYVAISLVVNVGRLSISRGTRLLVAGLGVLLLLWLIAVCTLIIVSQAFPTWETGSFFSSSLTEEPPAPNWMDLFIPSNPFRSLADSAIPAVVVFSIGLGIALMSVPNKQVLLEPLQILSDALARLNKLVVKLTPIGIFAIVAHAVGTTDVQQFILIQGYLLSYATASIILVFIVLPALVSAYPFEIQRNRFSLPGSAGCSVRHWEYICCLANDY